MAVRRSEPLCDECSRKQEDWREAKSVLSEEEHAELFGQHPVEGKRGRRECHYCQKHFCDSHIVRHRCPELKRLLQQLATFQKLVTWSLVCVVVYIAYLGLFIPLRNRYGYPLGEWLQNESAFGQLGFFLFVGIPVTAIVGIGLLVVVALIYSLLDHGLWGERLWHLGPGQSWAEGDKTQELND